MTNTRYNLLAELLRNAIDDGAFAPSGDLPTEAELCATHGVSRSTVRRALTSLRDEGLVSARQGSGWAVIDRSTPSILRLSVGGVDPGGQTIVDELLSCRRVRPPVAIARRLGVSTKRSLRQVRRRSLAADVVVHRSTTWFNAELTASLDVESASAFGPARMLRDRGLRLGPTIQLAGADPADADDVDAFGAEPGSPILEISRLVRDAMGHPLFVSIHRHPGAMVQVQVELPTSLDGATASLGDANAIGAGRQDRPGSA